MSAVRTIRRGIVCLLVVLTSGSASAQSSAFSYQGRLTENGAAANGTFDFEFRLFDNAGIQQGSAVFRDNVLVADGTFTVALDFGTAPFASSAATGLEVWVRPGTSTGGFQQLLPRHALNATPYAIRSIGAGTADVATNATQLGGVAAVQYVLTSDSRLSDARTPVPGNSNYVQNRTTAQTGNLNLTGSGIFGGTVTASQIVTQGSVGVGTSTPDRRLSVSGGPFWTNAIWTASLGLDNVSAIGWRPNPSGNRFGIGQSTGGLYFFRTANDPGGTNQPATTELFIHNEGRVGIGTEAPQARLGLSGGPLWTDEAWSSSLGLNNASAIGWQPNAGGTRFGIGQTTNGLFFFRTAATPGSATGGVVYDVQLQNDGVLYAQSYLRVFPFSSGIPPSNLCINAELYVSWCTSSLRYKANVTPFADSLAVVSRLRTISFDWAASGAPDLGLAAEEAAAADPRLVFRNGAGQVEGIQYNQLTAVLVGAINEQQAQLAQEHARVEALASDNAEMKRALASAMAAIAELERKVGSTR